VGMIDEDVLRIGINVDPSSGIKSIQKFDKEFIKGIKDVRSQMKVLDKEQKSYFGATRNAWRDVQDEVKASQDAMEAYENSIVQTSGAISEIDEALARVAAGTAKMSGAQIAAAKAHKAALQETVEEAEEARARLSELGSETVNIKMSVMTDELKDGLAKVAVPFKNLMSKDIPGAIEEGGKLAAAAIGASMKHGGKWIGGKGASLMGKGASMMSRGKATREGASGIGGAIKGAGMQGIGKIAQMIGGVASKLGPMLQMAAKFAPLISIAAGAVASLVKIMIDAEAQAKEFQKDLLASASTSEFLARNGNLADAAFDDLAETVKDIRNASYNFTENLKWGTTAKEHQAMWNTLNQEGVSIARMKGEFERAKKAGVEAGDAQSYYTKMTATSVAYSRNFGVALTEIVSFQAEMMTEMGMSADSASEEFARMSKAAGESGMAANKFFAIMRSISSDLAIYNMRMGEAAGLLKALGKAMSPKNAQKFMTTLAQGFKGMGRLEKLKMTLLAGEGETRKVVEKNLADRQNSLVKDVIAATHKPEEEVKAAVAAAQKGERGALQGMLKDVEGGGALVEASNKLRQDKKMSKKGTFGLSQSIGNLTTGGQMDMIKSALGKFGGKPGGKIEDIMGTIGGEMMAENMNISHEQLEQLSALEQAVDDQRKELVLNGKDGKKLSQKEVDEMSNDDIIKSLGLSDQELKNQMMTEKQLAQQQAGLTQSMMDKIGLLLDFVMNQIYNVMEGIYDALVDSFLGDAKTRAKRDLSKDVRQSGSKEAMQALSAAGGDPTKFKAAAAGGSLGKKLVDTLDEVTKREAAIAKKVEEEVKAKKISADDAEKRTTELTKGDARLQALYKVQEAASATMDPGDINRVVMQSGKFSAAEQAAIDKQLYKSSTGGQTEGATGGGTQQGEATGKSGLQAMKDAGIDPARIQEVLQKAIWESKSNKSVTDLAKTLEGAGGTVSGTTTSTVDAGGNPVSTAAAAPPPAAPAAATGQGGYTAPLAPPSEATLKKMGMEGVGGATGAPPPAAATSPQAVTAKSSEESAATSKEALATLGDMHDAMRREGIKLDKTFLKGPIGKQMEDSSYDAMSQALFEYWLYSAKGEDVKAAIADAKTAGLTDFTGKGMAEVNRKWWEKDTGLPAHAGGAIVTGGKGGIATTKPLSAAPGEWLVSAGANEAILPLDKMGPGAAKGAGGGKTAMSLDVNVTGAGGDEFQRGLKAIVANYVYEYESKKRLA
jgi:hypothetical protein